jgi:two-component system cell cycle sensor histidine kinase/response regulator CckA
VPDPLAAPAAVSAAGLSARLGCGALLLADDELPVRRFTAEYLELQGFEVLVASDGREALELLRGLDGRVDVAILDIAMPVLDGVAVMREIRRTAPGVKVILATGLAPGAAERLLDGDAPDAWVDSPMSPDPDAGVDRGPFGTALD